MLSLISAGVDKVGSFLVVLLLVFLLQTPDFIKGSPLSTSNNLSDQDAEDSTVLLSVPIGKMMRLFQASPVRFQIPIFKVPKFQDLSCFFFGMAAQN